MADNGFTYKKDIQFIKFCTYGFLKNLRFFEPFFILWLLSKNLSFFEIGIVYSVREIARNLLEIPSGFVADMIGRKKALTGSYLFYIISFLGYYFSSDYWFILVASVFYGIGDAFRSGTHKALIYSYLKQKNISHLKVEFYGQTRSWSMRGSGVAALLAAAFLFFSNSYNQVFLLSTIPYVLGILLILSYPRSIDTVQQVPAEKLLKSFTDLVKNMSYHLKSPQVLRIILNSAMIGGFYLIVRDYLQPILKNLSVEANVLSAFDIQQKEAVLVGIFYFIIYQLNALASQKANWLNKRIQLPAKAMNLTYIAGFSAGMAAGISYLFDLELLAAMFFLVLMVVHNIRKPIAVAVITDKFTDQLTSSVLSTESQLHSLLAAIFPPLLGLIADHTNIGLAMLITNAFLLLLLTIVYIKPTTE
ncbi:MAG: MFS transporter [Bacteroidetes bacterium]|nr:MFS transporter [Bacteroidota bacterium]